MEISASLSLPVNSKGAPAHADASAGESSSSDGTPSGPVPILVVGAGELGLAMIEALSAHRTHFAVSVLLRASTIDSADSSKAAVVARVRSLGATPVAGDFAASGPEAEAALASTFGRFDTVVVCAGFTHGGAGVQARMTRAAVAGGVRRYVPWQFGVDYDVLGAGTAQDGFDEQVEVRALLRAQRRTAWVVVSVGVFTSFLFEPWWGVVDVQEGTVRALGGWDTRITTTAPRDIGRFTVGILLERPEVRDEVVFVAGETLTYAQLAESVERGLGRSMKRELWDMDFLLEGLKKDPHNGLKKYRPIFAGDKGISWDYESSWNGRKGLKSTSTEDWARALSQRG